MKKLCAMLLSSAVLSALLLSQAYATSHPFTDVVGGSYYEESVIWAVESGVTNGTSATTFSPSGICTRAQVVTFLWNAAGQPTPTTMTNPFTDVKEGDWYYSAVLWAVEEGITAGTTTTTFSPSQTCTDAQVITFLWRANGEPSEGYLDDTLAHYQGNYYEDAIAWANLNNILFSASPFDPEKNTSRADIVTYLYRNEMGDYVGDARFVSAEDVGTYVMSQEAEALSRAMEVVTSGQLPQWRGLDVELHNWSFVHAPDVLPTEADIAQIAADGFNYIRLEVSNYYPYHHSASLTVGTQEGLVYDLQILESIGDIVSWCASYDIHVCLTMKNTPGFGVLWGEGQPGYETLDAQDLYENPERQAQFVEIWGAMASYFADVPANVLSYELINEPEDEEQYLPLAEVVIETIREADQEDKVIVSCGFTNQASQVTAYYVPTDELDSSIVQAIHYYPFNALNWSKYASLLAYPYDEAPVVNCHFYDGNPLTIQGEFAADSQVVLYIEGVDGINMGNRLELYADGVLVDYILLDDIEEGKNSCNYAEDTYAQFGYNGAANGWEVTLTTDRDAQVLELRTTSTGEGSSIFLNEGLVMTPSDTLQTYYLPANGTDSKLLLQTDYWNATYFYGTYIPWEDGGNVASTLTIYGDGTFSASPTFEEVYVYDRNEMYAFFQEWAQWSEETGTQLIVNEFMILGVLPPEVKTAYLTDLLSILEEFGIPWCYYNSTYSGMLYVPDINESAGDCTPELGYEYRDGIWVDMAVLEALME